jgi:hypothetical protein
MTTLKARGGTISAFNGIEPIIETFADSDRKIERSRGSSGQRMARRLHLDPTRSWS